MQENGQDGSKEEEENIHDAKRPRGLEHGAVLVDIGREPGAGLLAIVPERADLDVDGCGLEVGAAGAVDGAEFVDGSDEGADEAEVDKGDEEGGATGRAETEEGAEGPGAGEDGDDEENEDRGRRELVVGLEAIDEPGLVGKSVSGSVLCPRRRCGCAYQHANHWDERDNLSQSPEGEKESTEHGDAVCCPFSALIESLASGRTACDKPRRLVAVPQCWHRGKAAAGILCAVGSGSAAGALISVTSHVECRSDGGDNERVVCLRCANKEDTIVLFSGRESDARYSLRAEN